MFIPPRMGRQAHLLPSVIDHPQIGLKPIRLGLPVAADKDHTATIGRQLQIGCPVKREDSLRCQGLTGLSPPRSPEQENAQRTRERETLPPLALACPDPPIFTCFVLSHLLLRATPMSDQVAGYSPQNCFADQRSPRALSRMAGR